MWLQDPDSLSSGNSKLLMFFVGMVAVALAVQALALILMAVGAAKARKRGLAIAEEVRSKILPILDDSQNLLREHSPKLRIITDNIVESSHIMRNQAQELDSTLSDLNIRARAQAERVDGLVSSALDTSAEISNTIQRGIKAPVREVSSLLAGLKAALGALTSRSKHHSREGFPQDPDPGW